MLNNFRFKNTFESTIKILNSSIILCWLGWAIFYSLTASINIPTLHLDGAFQTASGLYRLDAGQFPGKDFYPYLGIGPLFALYPFFKAFGANISASVFAAHFVVLLISMLSTAFIWQLIWRPKSFLTSLVAGSLLFLAPIGMVSYFSLPLPDWMMFGVSPGNSLRPIRSSAPYLIAIIFYFSIFHIANSRNKYIFSGLLTGSILLWSNDFAIPSAGMLVFFIFVNALRCNEFKIKNVLVYLIATISSWITLITLATHGHPVELLKYNFFDVARDQWWFFSPYVESTRIFNLQQLTRLFSKENYIPLFVLTLIIFIALRTRLIEHALLLWIGAVLFAGGAVASVGGHLGGYFGAFYFWGMMTICIGLSHLAWLGIRKLSYKVTSLNNLSLMLIIVGVSMVPLINSFDNFRSAISDAKKDVTRFYVPELGGYLGKEWKEYIDLAKQTNETGVFEEYWGIWSATRRSFSAWPVDSVIHALGETRTKAASELQTAKLIITTREDAFSGWVGWNMSQNYWFYQNLLHEWTPIHQSPLTTVWSKGVKNQSSAEVPCQIIENDKVSIITTHHGFLEISLQYSVRGFRSLLLLANNMYFTPVTNGFISLDPKANNALIPAYADKRGENIYKARFLPASRNIDSRLESCKAKLFTGSLIYGKSMLQSAEVGFYISDENWIRGIARHWAGFFVPNEQEFFDEYEVGKLVKFADGSSREITRVNSSGFYLNIYLNGDPLDPEKVGLPNKFAVMVKPDHDQKDGIK